MPKKFGATGYIDTVKNVLKIFMVYLSSTSRRVIKLS